MILGLTGRKRSGKSTVARHLVDNLGFRELSFAARLKRMAVDVNPMVHYIDTHNLSDTDRELLANGVTPGPVYLLDALRVLGEERAKDALPEVRRFYQRLGTEGVRDNLGDTVWVDLVASQIEEIREEDLRARLEARGTPGAPVPPRTPLVLADVRFENEADLIRGWGGLVVEIRRPSQGDPADGHSSEAGVRADHVVENVEGDPSVMIAAVTRLLLGIHRAP